MVDIGQLEGEKDYKIIEYGCFNSDGFYDSNIKKIIKDISEHSTDLSFICNGLFS